MAVVVMVDDERDDERQSDESTYYRNMRFPRILLPAYTGKTGDCGVIGASCLARPVTLQIREAASHR